MSFTWLTRPTVLLTLSVLSVQANAWSIDSYQNIVNGALKGTPETLKQSMTYDPVSVGQSTMWVKQGYDLRKAFESVGRELPPNLAKLVSIPDSDKGAIRWYRAGFAPSGGKSNLQYGIELFTEAAKGEQDPVLKILLTSFASFYVIQAHQPNNVVTFFDSSHFSRGDNYGYLYCVSHQGKNKVTPICKQNLHDLWSTFGSGFPIEIEGTAPRKTAEQIILETANLAPVVYATLHRKWPSQTYLATNRAHGQTQAHKAAEQLVGLWKYLYEGHQ